MPLTPVLYQQWCHGEKMVKEVVMREKVQLEFFSVTVNSKNKFKVLILI